MKSPFALLGAVLLFALSTAFGTSTASVSYYRAEGNGHDENGAHDADASQAAFAAGKVGQAFSFNGSTGYVDFGDWFAFESFTIGTWINDGGTQAADAPIIALFDVTAPNNTAVTCKATGSGNQYQYTSNDGAPAITFTTTPGTWQYLVITRESLSRVTNVYLDGQMVGTTTGTGDLFLDPSFVNGLRAGGDYNLAKHWKGLLDEMRFVDRYLSPEEVKTLAADYDAVRDFTLTSNANTQTWQYGFTATDGTGFTADPRNDVNINSGALTGWQATDGSNGVVYNTSGANQGYNIYTNQQPDELGLFPSASSNKAVVRWLAPTSGTVSISGRFRCMDIMHSDGSIVQNGNVAAPLYNQIVAPATAQVFSLTNVSVSAGDTIDFRLGVGDDGYSYDGTGLIASITYTAASAPTIQFSETGPTSAGGSIHFGAVTLPGCSVRVQAVTKANPVESDWTDLNDGHSGHMTESATAGSYTLDTVVYPAGTTVSFRAIAVRSNQADIISVPLGPLVLHQPSLSIHGSVVTSSDPNGVAARVGDTITYQFTYQNLGDAPAKNLKVAAVLPLYFQAADLSNQQHQFDDTDISDLGGGQVVEVSTLAGGNTEWVLPGGDHVPLLDPEGNPRLAIVWSGTDLDPGFSNDVHYSIKLSSGVKIPSGIGGNVYTVFSTSSQPFTGADVLTSNASRLGLDVRGPIVLTATTSASQVSPGGLIDYTFTLKNLGGKTASYPVVIIDVPGNARLAGYRVNGKLVAKPAGAMVAEDVRTAGGEQLLLMRGPLPAPRAKVSPDPLASWVFTVTFQAKWIAQGEVLNRNVVVNEYTGAFVTAQVATGLKAALDDSYPPDLTLLLGTNGVTGTKVTMSDEVLYDTLKVSAPSDEVYVGAEIYGHGLPDGTTIVSISRDRKTLVLSNDVTDLFQQFSVYGGGDVTGVLVQPHYPVPLSEIKLSDPNPEAYVGARIFGTGIPAGTTILAIEDGGLTIYLSHPVAANVKGFAVLPQGSVPSSLVTSDDSGILTLPIIGGTSDAPKLKIELRLIVDDDSTTLDDIHLSDPGDGLQINTVEPGKELTLFILVKNEGKQAAEDVFVEDVLPAGTVLVSKGNHPVVLHHASDPADLLKAVSIAPNSPNKTVAMSQDDRVITFGGLHLDAGGSLSVTYTVKVLNEGPNAPAINSTIFTGTCTVGSGSSLQTTSACKLPPIPIPILVTGKFKYALDVKPSPTQCTPVTGAQVGASCTILNNLYKQKPTLLPEQPPVDAQHAPTPVPGDQRFIVRYANTSGAPVNNVELNFPIPANTIFYKASGFKNGKLAPLPNGATMTTPSLLQAGGTVTVHFSRLGATPTDPRNPSEGEILVEVVVLGTVVQTDGSFTQTLGGVEMHDGASLVAVRAPLAQPAPLPQTAPPNQATAAPITVPVGDDTQVPQLGLMLIAPTVVLENQNFDVFFVMFNFGSTGCQKPVVSFGMPENSSWVGADYGGGFFSAANNPPQPHNQVNFEMASNNGTVPADGSPWFLDGHSAAIVRVTLKAGAAGTLVNTVTPPILYTQLVGDLHAPDPIVIPIKSAYDPADSPTATHKRVVGPPFVNAHDGIAVIPLGGGKSLVAGSPAFVTTTGNIDLSSQNQDTIVASADGNNLLVAGVTGFPQASSFTVLANLPQLLASNSVNLFNGGLSRLLGDGGAGIISHDGGTIISHDGGTIIAQISKIVASGGGNVVRNVIAQGVADLDFSAKAISNNGSSFNGTGTGAITTALEGNILTFGGAQVIKTAAMTGLDPRGTRIISHDGGTFEVSDPGTSAIVASGGGNIVSAGGGNIVSEHGAGLTGN